MYAAMRISSAFSPLRKRLSAGLLESVIGRLRRATAGGESHRQLKEDFTATIEPLLAEEAPSNTAPSEGDGQR